MWRRRAHCLLGGKNSPKQVYIHFMSWHWSYLLMKYVDSFRMSEQFTPQCSSQLTSCHTCSHFTLASPGFVFNHDQLNHTEFLSFPSVIATRVFLILSLLMQPFWHTGQQWGAFAHAVRMNTLIWMHISYFCYVYVFLPLNIHVVWLLKLFHFIVTAILIAEWIP